MPEERGTNPFHAVYLSEALSDDPTIFRDLFSSEILTGETKSLFRAGNIVLLGSNGTGKTMLLGLFSPEVHAAYLNQKQPFPLERDEGRFLSVGINFTHAGFNAFGQRPVAADPETSFLLWPRMIGDFLNYFFVYELLRVLRFLGAPEGARLAEYLGAHVEQSRLDTLASWMSKRECWFGALVRRQSFDTVYETIRTRIFTYRSFANWNIAELPRGLTESKTDIGIPLADTRVGLEKVGILDASVPLMVTIDQYETLIRDYTVYEPSLQRTESSLDREFCRTVNSFVGTRNPKISYKIGVRPYAWNRERRGLGTDARLEHGRDFQIVNLDDVLRRRENTSAWIFPSFARDVARRRLAWVGRTEFHDLEQLLEPLEPKEELERYCSRDPMRLLPKHENVPAAWNNLLETLYRKDKFEARMASVWIFQQGGRTTGLPETPSDRGLDWTREWWQKERREALLTQIASECRQRRLFAGWPTLMTLSASNILVFLSLCREIWDIWERAQLKATYPLRSIKPDIQSQAIRVVSDNWLRKQEELPGGARRRDFVTRLGVGIRKAILADRGLAYPGHTGFSLLTEDYDSRQGREVKEFLDNATDFGALISLPHTTKEKDRKPRVKWYLFPALCPHFDIPAIRTKEPYYATLDEVAAWLSEARPPIEFRSPRKKQTRRRGVNQESLFDPENP